MLHQDAVAGTRLGKAVKLPKSPQPKAKCALQKIWMAETKAAAQLHSTPSSRAESYTPKYDKAADARATIGTRYGRSTTSRLNVGNTCKHLRYRASPHESIEGVAYPRGRLAMVLKLLEAAQKSWHRLDGHNRLSKLVLGVTFTSPNRLTASP
jgi:hypothetical protein